MFYLVMPKDQTGALTEESSTDEVKDLSPSEAASQPQEVTLLSSEQDQEDEDEKTPCRSPNDESHTETLSHETGLSQSRPCRQQHVIKNVDEIFQTIEEMMKKLHQLREIEADYYRLLRTARKSPVSEGLDDLIHRTPSIIRTPSMDRGAGDGIEEGSKEPAQPEIHSTGF